MDGQDGGSDGKIALLLGVIFFAVGCLALVIAYGKDAQGKDWLLTGIPAWLQGIGTVLAAYVAWHAFQLWGVQEKARRKADLAEVILRRGFVAINGIRHARSPSWRGSRTAEEDAKDAIGGRRQWAVERMTEAVDALMEYVDIAEMRLSNDVALTIRELDDIAQSVRVAYISLAKLETGEFKFEEEVPGMKMTREDALNTFMDVLVEPWEAPLKGRKPRRSEFAEKLDNAMMIFKRECEPHLDYAKR
jgi:hypothetical protein